MNLISLKCPECGAIVDIEDGINTFYCKYCGAKIAVNENDPEIIKAKLHIKEMEHEERMLEKKLEARDRFWNPNKYKTKEELAHQRKLLYIILAIFIAYFIFTLLLIKY